MIRDGNTSKEKLNIAAVELIIQHQKRVCYFVKICVIAQNSPVEGSTPDDLGRVKLLECVCPVAIFTSRRAWFAAHWEGRATSKSKRIIVSNI